MVPDPKASKAHPEMLSILYLTGLIPRVALLVAAKPNLVDHAYGLHGP